MKRNILLLILLLTGLAAPGGASAQAIIGDWYTPLRNKLLHIIISKDSVLFRKCSFDAAMSDYGYALFSFRVEKVVNGCYIVSGVMDVKDSVPTFHLLQFRLQNGRNYLNIESLNHGFPTLADAEDSIGRIERQPLGIALIGRPAVRKILQQRNLSEMTAGDFNRYALQIIGLDSANASILNKKCRLTYVYMESTTRMILADLGFNSLVIGQWIDGIYEKFAESPETKKLFEQMAGLR